MFKCFVMIVSVTPVTKCYQLHFMLCYILHFFFFRIKEHRWIRMCQDLKIHISFYSLCVDTGNSSDTFLSYSHFGLLHYLYRLAHLKQILYMGVLNEHRILLRSLVAIISKRQWWWISLQWTVLLGLWGSLRFSEKHLFLS